jgi:chromosome segregation ATPase
MKTDLVERLRRQYREQGTNYVQEAADVIESLRVKILDLRDATAELERERDALRNGLEDAIECVESWSAYVSNYFKTKHNLEGDLTRLRVILNAMGAKP